MRKTLAILFFILGCVVAGFAVFWLIAAQFGILVVPRTPLEAVAVFSIYAILMLATLDRSISDDWAPIFGITRSRILFARGLLSLIGVFCFVEIAVAVIGRVLGCTSLLGHAFLWVISSLLLLNGVYVALHWAYRPSNLFGSRISPALLDPLGNIIVAMLRTIGVVKRPEDNGSERK
jgi:hypothetical protein